LGRDDCLRSQARDYSRPFVSDLLASEASPVEPSRKGEKPYLPINFVSYLRGQHYSDG
jgi:hypothetical protein